MKYLPDLFINCAINSSTNLFKKACYFNQKFALFIFIYHLSNSLFSQNVINDQIITTQNIETDTRQVIYLLDSVKLLKKNYAHQEALDLAQKALNKSIKIKNVSLQIKSYYAIGECYYNLNDFRDGISNYLKAEKLLYIEFDSVMLSNVYIDLGFSYAINGRPDSALYFAFQALQFAKKKSMPLHVGWSYRILGDVQYTISNYDKALEYYKNGVDYLNQFTSKDSLIQRELSLLMGNMAMTYAEKQDIEYSKHYYLLSDSIAKMYHINDVIIGNKYGISYTYIYAQNYPIAIQSAHEALQYYISTNDYFYLEGCWESLGESHYFSGNLDSAEYFLKKAEASSIQNDSYDFTKEVYKFLSLVYEAKNEFALSLKYHKLYKEQTDSLYSQNRIYQLDVLEVSNRLELVEKERELLLISQSKDAVIISEQKKSKKYLLIAFILTAVVASLLTFLYSLKQNKNKNLKLEVERRTQEIQNVNQSLHQANLELQEFAHISFHDLREPIRNINSFANLIQKKGLNISKQEIEDYTSLIQFNAKQMQLLVYDVFEFVNVNKFGKNLEYFSPDEITDDVLKLLNHNIQEKSVHIIKNIQVEKIKSNKGMLSIALRNLLENAIKYNTSKNPEIKIEMHNGMNKYTWYVKDNGIGIEPQYHERIFEMFKRLHNREIFQGSGLGLSITKKIINKLDGEIGVISDEGKGAIFWFSIPKVDD